MSEAVVPPRALWVPFPLGRPLGAVDDSEFQKNVMRTAFGLLDRTNYRGLRNTGARRRLERKLVLSTEFVH